MNSPFPTPTPKQAAARASWLWVLIVAVTFLLLRLAGFFSLGYILYEFAQPVLPKGVFDWKDVYGTAIGLSLSLPVLALLWRLYPVTKAGQAMGGHSI